MEATRSFLADDLDLAISSDEDTESTDYGASDEDTENTDNEELGEISAEKDVTDSEEEMSIMSPQSANGTSGNSPVASAPRRDSPVAPEPRRDTNSDFTAFLNGLKNLFKENRIETDFTDFLDGISLLFGETKEAVPRDGTEGTVGEESGDENKDNPFPETPEPVLSQVKEEDISSGSEDEDDHIEFSATMASPPLPLENNEDLHSSSSDESEDEGDQDDPLPTSSSPVNSPAPSSTAAVGLQKSAQRKSKSKRAGLTFPVGRIHRYLKESRIAPRIEKSAAVYMAATLEYLTAEMLEVAGKVAKENKKARITPPFITLALRGDDEMDELLQGVTIPLLPPAKKKAKAPTPPPKKKSPLLLPRYSKKAGK